MLDDIIKWIVRSVVESFPIDPKRKGEVFKNIQKRKWIRRQLRCIVVIAVSRSEPDLNFVSHVVKRHSCNNRKMSFQSL